MKNIAEKLSNANANINDVSYITAHNIRIEKHRILLNRFVDLINETYEKFVVGANLPNEKRMRMRHKANSIPKENYTFWELIDECVRVYGRDFYEYLDHIEYENATLLQHLVAFLSGRWYASIDYNTLRIDYEEIS